DRVPKILSRCPAVVREPLSIVSGRGGHAPALASNELAANQKFVGLLDPEPSPVFSHELRIAHCRKKENAKPQSLAARGKIGQNLYRGPSWARRQRAPSEARTGRFH